MFKCLSLISLIAIWTTSFASAEIKTPAPVLLPNVERDMKSPGYWINRHASPDDIIMTSEDIQRFNNKIREEQHLTRDIFQPEEFLPHASPQERIQRMISNVKSDNFVFLNGQKPTENFWGGINQNLLPDQTFEPQYALITSFADERLLPTDTSLYEEAGDIEFDQLQNSGLDIGTPILVLHYSADKEWAYEINELTEGWIKTENFAVGHDQDIKRFAQSQSFAMIIKPKADIFMDERQTQFLGYVRMGAKFPLMNGSMIQVPVRDESGGLTLTDGHMNAEDIHIGFLPYTARNIYKQAFAMINAPYGWGGMNDEQDCSRFLQEIFATVGIRLPRNSKEQAQTGYAVPDFSNETNDKNKIKILNELNADIHILTLKGHIMLYLGSVDGRPYAIHAVYAYRGKSPSGDIAHVINRVAVTDLSLGEGSKKGSLLKRLTGIRKVDF